MIRFLFKFIFVVVGIISLAIFGSQCFSLFWRK